MLHKTEKSSPKRAQYELLQRQLSKQRKGKHIQGKNDHKTEGQDVQCGASLHMMEQSHERKSNRKTKRCIEFQTASGIVRYTNESKIYFQGFGAVVGTMMRWVGLLLLVVTKRKSKCNEK